MNCEKCGFNNPDNAQFCQSCGEPFTQAVNEQPAHQPAEAAQTAPTANKTIIDEVKSAVAEKKFPKKIAIIAAALAAVILLIALICAFSSSGKFEFAEGDYRVIYTEDDNSSAVLYDGKVIAKDIEGEISITEASKGTKAFFVNEEGNLYQITKEGAEKLVGDVSGFSVSSSGDTIVYLDKENALFSYSIKKEEKTRIAGSYVSSYVMSEDGKAVAYTERKLPEKADDITEALTAEYVGHVYYKGESVKIGKDVFFGAISNGAKYIYYTKADDKGETDLYLTNLKDERVKIASEVEDVVWNADLSQILFNTDGKWYVSVKGGEKVKVDGISSSISYLYVLSPDYASGKMDKLQDNYYVGYNGENYTIYLINKKWSAEKLASNVDDYAMSEDGETIYYSKDNKVYILGNDESIEKEVSSFAMMPDGSGMYFINEDDTLYYKKGTSEKQRISDDVETMSVTHDGYVIYRNEDKEMYASNKGKSPERLAEDVTYIYTCVNYTYFKADVQDDGECDIYVAKSKAKFESLLSDVCKKASANKE